MPLYDFGGKKHDIAEKKIRTTKRQIHRDKPASTPCEFY